MTALSSVLDALELVESVGMLPDVVLTLNTEIFGHYFLVERPHRRDFRVCVAYCGARPVGFMLGYPGEAGSFIVGKGGVVAAARGHGVARALLLAMVAAARRAGSARCAFHTTNASMKRVGERLGFQVRRTSERKGTQMFRLEIELVDQRASRGHEAARSEA